MEDCALLTWNSGKETFVAKFVALSQHLPRRIGEIMKILMQYIKCTSQDLIQTNVTARAKLFGGVSWGGGNIYTYIYLHNFTTAIHLCSNKDQTF